MWMGMDLSVSKDEKESLSAIMWFEALEYIKSALEFELLVAIKAILLHCNCHRITFLINESIHSCKPFALFHSSIVE